MYQEWEWGSRIRSHSLHCGQGKEGVGRALGSRPLSAEWVQNPMH